MPSTSSRPIDTQAEIYRTYVEEAEDGIFIASPEGVYLHINGAGHRMLGYDPGELLGKTIADIVCRDQYHLVASELNRTGSIQVHLREWTLIRKDGSRLESEIVAQRLENGFMIATVRDRTRRIEEEKHQRELLERLHKLASHLPGAVYQLRLDANGHLSVPYASNQLKQIFNIDPEAVSEDASALLALVHPGDYECVKQSMQRSADHMQAWEQQWRIRLPDGEIRWLSGNGSPEKQEDGAILWHGFICDVTERKEEETLKAQLQTQLQQSQKVESIGRLAGGVAHDFNNLLTSILGFSELTLGELPQDSTAASYIRKVMETANRGAALTQQLLAFARKKIVRPEAVNLSEIVSQLVPMVERLVGDDVEVGCQSGDDAGTVLIDIGSLEQLVINLVINARDAMPMGGKLTLETCNCSLDATSLQGQSDLVPGEYVLLTVNDSGNGIHPDFIDRIFEPFFTTKAPGHGTGLGLATCYGIVKQAGGHIVVNSLLGEGSTFKIYLPRIGLHGGQRAVEPFKPRVRKEGNETILVVEDEKTILAVAKEALTDLGYKVLTESNGATALELAEQYPERIDLLFTDVVMPKMGGKELAARLGIRRHGIKVLYTSGYTGDAIVNRGVLEQGVEFLQKPYTLQALAEKIRDILDGD